MAHKEWEPDDFLDEFLDFDYRKPVPDNGRSSRGLPAGEARQPKQEQKSYGLRDDYKLYEDLRHGNDRNAGQHASAKAEADSLRSSGALRTEIPEPLSAKRKVPEPSSSKMEILEPLSSRRPVRSEPQSAPKSRGLQEDAVKKDAVKKAPAEIPGADKPKAAAAVKSKRKPIFSRDRASELASGALGAARKFVSTDEDQAPEEIPSASANVSELAGMGAIDAVHDPYVAAQQKALHQEQKPAAEEQHDELAELFAELGETAENPVLSSDENAALVQAQQDAYDRYRGNYVKGLKKSMARGKAGPFPRWLSRIYVVALAAFTGIMTIMNVLPFGMLIALYIVLGLLSIIIVMQLRKANVKKWARVLASMTAILLIGVFGVGTAYAMGTLSFLDSTSVKNENRVGFITREPFNVCITGIDVRGTIEEQGRSDVNMIVTVNPKTEQILMTSIPRDYQIYMPDKDNAMDKLTHTGFYSVETTIGAEENLLDTKINYYVKVNFTTVMMFIDAIGGIDVYSEYEFYPVKRDWWKVEKGWNHMNGREALAFARERKAFVDGDNQRIKNQQAVFEAIIKKATSSKTMVLSYNKILSNLKDYFQMSFSSAELRSLVKFQIGRSPDWKIFKNTIVGGNGSMPTYTTGNAYAYVMTQDETSINNAKDLINAVLSGQLLEKDDDGNVFATGGEEDGESVDPEGE